MLRSALDRTELSRETLLLLRPLPIVRSVKKQLLLDYLVPPPDTICKSITNTILQYSSVSSDTEPGAGCIVGQRRPLREPQSHTETLKTLSTPESTPQLNTFNVPTEPVEMPAVETVLPPEARRLELWDRGRKLVTYSDKSGETRLATWRLPRSSNDAVLLEASARKLYVCAHIHPKDRHVKRTYDRPDSEDSCDSDTDAPDYIPDLSRPQLCSIVDEIVSGCADRMRVDSAVLAPAAQTCKDLLPAAREHELIGTRAMAKLLMQRVAKICIEWSAKSMSDDS